MTGFLVILYALLTSLLSFSKKQRLIFFIAIAIAVLSYVPTFYVQVLPFLSDKMSHYLFLSGTYGTGFSPGIFWAYEIPVLVLFIIAVAYFVYERKIPIRNVYIWLTLIVTGMVLSRSIAHTRLQSFVDLFFIIFLVRF
jgi:hypothetical protein